MATACFVLFIAIVPIARVSLAQVPAFVPSTGAALYFINLVTAALLYERAARLQSAAVLALACGYLFAAFIVVPHALAFPGAFAPEGLLGGGLPTAAWLDVSWRGGFPLSVMAYALLRRRSSRGRPLPLARVGLAIGASMAGVAVLVTVLTLLAIGGEGRFLAMTIGFDGSLAATTGIAPAVCVLTLVALTLLWQRPQRAVDLWLMLVLWIWLLAVALSALIGASRFDLGWYAGSVFGLVATGVMLIALLVEMAQIHSAAMDASAGADRRAAKTARPLARSDPPPPAGNATDAFIRRQNIAHYRSLLESGRLDEAQRRSIERMLSEEEAKQSVKRSPG